MPRQRIEFMIKPDGTVTEQVEGVAGPHCEQLTKKIEERLGEVTDRERRPEFWNQQFTDTSGNVTGEVGGLNSGGLTPDGSAPTAS